MHLQTMNKSLQADVEVISLELFSQLHTVKYVLLSTSTSCVLFACVPGHIPALSCAPDLRVADCLSMILRQMFPHAFEGALHLHGALNPSNTITGMPYLPQSLLSILQL